MNWLSKLVDKILGFIKKIIAKIVDALGPYLPIIIIALFILLPALAPFLASLFPVWMSGVFTAIAGWGFWTSLAVGLGVSYLIVPDETGVVLGDTLEIVGEVAGEVVEVGTGIIDDVITQVGSSVFGSITDSPLLMVGLGVAAYFLLTTDETEDEKNIRNASYDNSTNTDSPFNTQIGGLTYV